MPSENKNLVVDEESFAELGSDEDLKQRRKRAKQTEKATAASKKQREAPVDKRLSVPTERKVVVKSMIDAGMSYAEIKKVIPDVSKGYITRISREFKSNKALVDYYKENRLQILAQSQIKDLAIQDAIVDTITDDEIEGLTPNEKSRLIQVLGTDFGIKFDKERLEKGESTENVAVLHKYIQEMKKREQVGSGNN